MVKPKRPVLVISPKIARRPGLVTVAALSTVRPSPAEAYHMLIPPNFLPQLGRYQKNETWLKGDMIYTVGFHRLHLIQLNKRGPNGKRVYFRSRLGREQMRAAYRCVLQGLGLEHLTDHV